MTMATTFTCKFYTSTKERKVEDAQGCKESAELFLYTLLIARSVFARERYVGGDDKIDIFIFQSIERHQDADEVARRTAELCDSLLALECDRGGRPGVLSWAVERRKRDGVHGRALRIVVVCERSKVVSRGKKSTSGRGGEVRKTGD